MSPRSSWRSDSTFCWRRLLLGIIAKRRQTYRDGIAYIPSYACCRSGVPLATDGEDLRARGVRRRGEVDFDSLVRPSESECIGGRPKEGTVVVAVDDASGRDGRGETRGGYVRGGIFRGIVGGFPHTVTCEFFSPKKQTSAAAVSLK